MTEHAGSRLTPLFTRLVHSDWSKHPAGRWTATGTFRDGSWYVEPPRRVGPLDSFVDHLFATADGPTLAGFDFPIGLPIAYARKAEFSDFGKALDSVGTGVWRDFYAAAETPEQVHLHRPFYPQRSGPKGSVRHQHLFDGHGVAGMADLTRRCERKPAAGGKAASSMFWTLGAAAAGKAALHGWQDAIVPARRRGARLWPFDGDLAALAADRPLVLAETYPGDAVVQIGLPARGWAKTNIANRRDRGPAIREWAARRHVRLALDLETTIGEGFAPPYGEDDGFDAIIGLLAMIAVVTGERPPGAPKEDDVRRCEGWILGRGTPALLVEG